MSPTATALSVQLGDQMPSVGLRATDGYLMNLRSYVGRRPAIFVFFSGPSQRSAARERGNELARVLAAAHPRLEREGIALAGVTTDAEGQQAAYLAELELPFPLFCDERRTASMLLGIPLREQRGNVNAEPTAFAVGEDGTILDIVERVEPRGLIARLVEAIHPPE